jgi:4-nitrophenyl phosphatase
VRQNLPDCRKIRYIGSEAMGEELKSNGLEVVGGTLGDKEYELYENHLKYSRVADLDFDPEIKAVVCGIDFAVNYSKIALASFYI